MSGNEDIPSEVGRNLSQDEAKELGIAGPPCVKPGGAACTKGDLKCVNHVEFQCGTGGWFKNGNKC